MQTRAPRIGIVGSYGGLNLGDEAILDGILTELRSQGPVEVTVFSRNPADTLARHRVERAVPVRDFVRAEVLPEIERLDLVIVGGGGILFDGEASLYLREAMLAQDLGIPVVIYAVSAGPLKQQSTQRLVRECLNRAALVTVRERHARKLLEDIGVETEIVVTADPALLLEPEPLPPEAVQREGLDPGRALVGISVREPGPAAPDIDEAHYHALLADAADYMVDRLDANLLFVPMEPGRLDPQQAHAVIARMSYAQRANVLKGNYNPGQILSLMRHFVFAVGMRLHFLIFAALERVPFVALPYAGKVEGFLEALQVEAPPMQSVTAGRLIAYLDRSWDRRREFRTRIEPAVLALKETARETNRLLMPILEERRAAAGRTEPMLS